MTIALREAAALGSSEMRINQCIQDGVAMAKEDTRERHYVGSHGVSQINRVGALSFLNSTASVWLLRQLISS